MPESSCTVTTCDSDKRLPCEMIDQIMDCLRNPTDKWRDFNKQLHYYKSVKSNTDNWHGMLCFEDLDMEEPNPADYTSLT